MAVEKVKDPLKQVTDPVLLSALAKQGIDKDYVEFYQDYAPAFVNGKRVKGRSPYAKFYRDLKSNKRFMVVSGLPMVNADGAKIEVGWKAAGINYFSEKNNLFRAKVQGTQVEITIKNDQPDGRKANDRLSYKPQLFLDGIEYSPPMSLLLTVDPLNPNYAENTLEWDYGICKRRLRIMEGSVLGSWVFTQKPSGEVRIKYNQVGDYRLRLGQFKSGDDEEQITPEQFDELALLQGGYPVTIGDSDTFYPDADPETTSIDGYVAQTGFPDFTWAEIRALTSGSAADDSGTVWYIHHGADDETNRWRHLFRALFLFDTSALDDTAVISSATLSLYGKAKADGLSSAPDINIYSSTPASNTALAVGDYDQVGATAFSTPISYANWKIADPFWNDFALNADGLAAITKTGVSKFSAREVTHDVGGTAPPWVNVATSYLQGYASEQGAGYKPKLVVTYTPAPSGRSYGFIIG